MVKQKSVGYSGRKKQATPGYYVMLVFLSLVCFSMLYPFVNLLFQSVSPATEIVASHGLMLYPKKIQLDAYRYLMKYPYLKESYQNTVFITVVGTALCMIMTTLGGYVLSRRDLPGRMLLTTFVVVTMFFSGGMIPNYLNLRNMGLLNTRWVLIFPMMISTWNMLLMRNFIMGIPIDLTEAALIDGANEVRLVLSIILPLSKPILAVLALWVAVGQWNAYFDAMLYTNSPELKPLALLVREMVVEAQGMNENSLMVDANVASSSVRAATILISLAPILCVYPFLQKYFVKGVMVGALKG